MSGIMPEDNGRISESAILCARGLEGFGSGFLQSFHGRERDFLRLGHALEEFNARAAEVSREAANLAELTSGESVANASARLSSHLERLAGASESAAAGGEITNLDVIASLGVKLTEHMRDFTRLVKHLSMLGIATRIESARLGNQGLGFSTLADDVEKLAGKIAASSEKITKRSQMLASQCQVAGKSLVEMDQARKACSRSAMELLLADLDALDSLTQSSRKSSSEISDEASSMVQSISEAVLSMQFHDIIRQQLEHVAEAADEARIMALEGPQTEGGHNARDWRELSGWMLSVLVLQHSQLNNARTRFSEAMGALESSLSDIAVRVRNMASQAGSLASQEAGQGGVLGQIESEVRRIAQALRDYSILEKRMDSVMREVGGSIKDMTASVSEIEEVGSEIELIALNASVKAAHTGEEGKALGVLASAIQKLSVDARGQTDRIMELLATVDSSSLALAQTQGEQGGAFEAVVADLDNEVAGFRAMEEQAAQLAGRVQALASGLSDEIGRTVQTLEFRYGLITEMTQAESKLGDLCDGLRKVLPEGAETAESPKLREMLDRYTMEAERLVHENVLGISPGSSAEQDGGEFGGNVELF